MSFKLGSTSIGSIYLGSTKVGEAYLGNVKVYASTPVDPYNPLGLPPYTMRLQFTQGYTPTTSKGSLSLVDAQSNIWDLTYENTSWESLLSSANRAHLLSVLGANASGVTNMNRLFLGCNMTSVPLFNTSSVTTMESMFDGCEMTSVPLFNTSSVTTMASMFEGCENLTSVPLFNTSSVTTMESMFENCESLTSVPLFNTSSVTNMSNMFWFCYAVESGALALYQQASTQANPPSEHIYTFYYCGYDTVTGAQELAQIPTDWGGTGSK